jgi:probable phosphoglycerate mutase
MSTRTLHVTRHGEADVFGHRTDRGRGQCRALAGFLAHEPIDAIWHSPLERAHHSAEVIAGSWERTVRVDEVAELVDHVPFIPPPGDLSPALRGFFDGTSDAEREEGERLARALTARFLRPPSPGHRGTHELLVTHAYQVAWMVRECLAAPSDSWLSFTSIANTGYTRIELAAGERPALIEVNDQSHLPEHLRWTGFSTRGPRP